MKNKKYGLILLIAFSFFCALLFSNNTYAEKLNQSYFVKKASLQGLFRCGAGETKNNTVFLRDGITSTNWHGMSSLYDNHGKSDWDTIPMPTGFLGFDMTDCKGVIMERKGANAFDHTGTTVPTSESGLDDFLTKKMGYTSSYTEASSTGSKCIHATWTKKFYDAGEKELGAYTTEETSSICFELDENDIVTSITIEPLEAYTGWEQMSQSYMYAKNGVLYFSMYGPADGPDTYAIGYAYENVTLGGLTYSAALEAFKEVLPKTWMKFDTKTECYDTTEHSQQCRRVPDSIKGQQAYFTVTLPSVVEEDSATATAKTSTYSMPGVGSSGFNGGIRPVAGLTGYKLSPSTFDETTVHAYKNMYFTKPEKAQLYVYYFEDSGAKPTCYKGLTDLEKSSMTGPFKYFENGSDKITKECYAELLPGGEFNGLIKVTGGITAYISEELYKFDENTKIRASDMIDFFNSLPDDFSLGFEASSSTTGDTDPKDPAAVAAEGDEYEKTKDTKNCYDSAGASNWIACPIIDNGTSASERMYAFIEGMLQVNTLLFTTNNGANGTFDAWGSFRNFANIAFIIVFVVVVLSQVTGFGIDNYGIKKILPKLILGALLVNISYFVCQAAVDAANITGGGLKELFKGIEGGLTNNQQVHFAFGTNKVLAGITILNAANLLAGIVAAAWYFSGGGILVPILLGVIGIVIGIIFFLVLLAVRQGLAVILVVISPLAFVAYMLPNTKSLFSKWLKLLSATLLAYPICSLAVYGGQMVSTIILVGSAKAITEGLMVTNFALALTSAILSIAPVFFIPTLITKSMSGISTVANGLKARASSLGRGAFDRSHTADNMRNVAKARKDNMNTERARRTKAALEERRKANGGRLSIADRARLRTANNTIDAYEKGNESLYAGMVKDMELGTEGGTEGLYGMANEAIREHDMEKLSAVIDRMNASGNEEAAQKVLRNASAQASKMSIGELEKFKNITAQKGGSLGKAYVKALASHMSSNGGERIDFDTAMKNGAMKKAMANMGEGALAGMNKDEMSFLTEHYGDSLGDLFDAKQIAAAAATHTSGKAGANFASMLEKITAGKSTEEIQKIRNTLSAEQWAKASEQTLNAFNSKLSDGDTFNASMAQAIVDSGNGTLMSSINSELQKNLVAKANAAKAEGQKAATEYQNKVSETLNQINEQLKNKPNTP